MTIYLDNAATTPLYPEVIDLLNDLNKNLYGNPSSLHSIGRKSKKELKKARQYIASTINAKEEEIVFTASATEANNMVFKSLDYDLIITSPTEHPCVLEPAKATMLPIIWLNLDSEGFIDINELEKNLESFKKKKILVSIMHGNNEIGTIQNLEAIGKLKTKYPNFIFHSDCVQTYTKTDINVEKFNLDCISASAHKIHGPKGVGFLYMKKTLLDEISLRRKALIIGGGQENEHRSGTENLTGIIAFSEAAKISIEKDKDSFLELWKNTFQKLKEIPGAVIHGPKDLNRRVPGNINISFTETSLNSEELVLQLDLAGIAASSGSACSSNKAVPSSEVGIMSSYVLRACQIEESLAKKAVRFSISRLNTEAELGESLKITSGVLGKFSSELPQQA